jgi:hypothetical protein
MDKQAKANMYCDFLVNEGYKPEVDADGDVRFKSEGKWYFVEVDEKDETYFRICFPNFWGIENPEERLKVLAACDYANSRSKVAKLFTVRDDVWASIEVFVAEPAGFKPLFTRCMAALQNGARNFVEKMRESATK